MQGVGGRSWQTFFGDWCRDAFDGGDEAVSAAGQGFDEAWVGCGIAQRLANLVYGGIQAVIEIHKGVGGPDGLAEAFASDDLSGILEECGEDLKGLLLKTDACAVLTQLSGGQVGFEDSEAQEIGFAAGGWLRHDGAGSVSRGGR